MTTRKHNIRMPTALKAEVTDYAWANRVRAPEVIREIVTDYAGGEPQAAAEGEYDEVIKFTIDEDIWEAAMERANQERASLSEVIRQALRERIQSDEQGE